MTTQRIKRACLSERFEDALVADAKVDSLAQIEQGAERSALSAGSENRIDCGASDVSDSAKAKPNLPITNDSELVARFVDVGRKNLESRLLYAGNVELTRLVDVLDDVFEVADLRG